MKDTIRELLLAREVGTVKYFELVIPLQIMTEQKLIITIDVFK